MSVRLIFALHFHQPVGNFDSVFEDAVLKCYEPIIEHFERHNSVRAAFHLSGCLLEWLENHDRKLLDRIFQLVSTHQVEPLGGGFYEPILSVIPRDDALEQIARLSSYWKMRCGTAPEGAWLPERVWEPALAELLSTGGIRYTILDDQHLRFSGIVRDRMTGLFTTERAGKGICFFPSDYKLRYLIPFRTVEKVREHFAELAKLPSDPILTYGDDAEKFGLWPGTHQWVFKEKWLELFLTYLEETNAPVRVVTPGEIFRNRPVPQRVYVPNASYSEMLEWALPAESVAAYIQVRDAAKKDSPDEAVKSFVRGSLWDMFLARYPESDQILKHVIRTSQRVRSLAPGPSRERALTSVLRAECNCPYWHGLFGGIYLPHLRHGVLTNLLDADAILAEEVGSKVSVCREDYDGDLEDEVVVTSKNLQAFFRPSDGGTLAELDYLPCRFNVTNVVSRWKESYHTSHDITHSQGSSEGPASPHELSVGIRPADLKDWTFDTLPLRTFRDFTSTEALDGKRLRNFEGMTFAQGRVASWEPHSKGWKGTQTLGPLQYQKNVELLDPDTISVRWTLDSSSSSNGFFGTILALTLLTPDASDRRAEIFGPLGSLWKGKPGDAVEFDQVKQLTWEDAAFGFGFDVRLTDAARLVTLPIQTLQRSEKGYEAVYQGTLIAITWPTQSMVGGSSARADIHFRRL